ncbi:MAG TPA: arsenosugar biosynthesis radical SAM (seleno)protein ArsS [Thermodesulfovibrionales bacterium]|nr:arsenosugar biosynthesis radical SAM (seleno)protein ArsS [Thermodesulfovibrionales bacterium]
MTFNERILSVRSSPLSANVIDIVQVNLGYKCNMACKHCHIGAGPDRTEEMDKETVDTVLRVATENHISILDITGGAPELNAHFRYLVQEARKIGLHVVVRTNLTIFFEGGMEDLPDFYEANGVEIIASLPYYTEGDVDRVRGKGAFQKSIIALKKLNSRGYGSSSGKRINLVYNPRGAFLAPPQKTVEQDYKRELQKKFGIVFDNLYAFTNMPIGRFKDYLIISNNCDRYMENLIASFNPLILDGLMCRYLINISWDGMLHDCDFNQILGLKTNSDCPQHIRCFDYRLLSRRRITVGEHCYGCTAGQGST